MPSEFNLYGNVPARIHDGERLPPGLLAHPPHDAAVGEAGVRPAPLAVELDGLWPEHLADELQPAAPEPVGVVPGPAAHHLHVRRELVLHRPVVDAGQRAEAEWVRHDQRQRQGREEEVRVLHDAIAPSPPLQLPLLFHGGRDQQGFGLDAAEDREEDRGGYDLNGFVQERLHA
jgi:hypothetical protein